MTSKSVNKVIKTLGALSTNTNKQNRRNSRRRRRITQYPSRMSTARVSRGPTGILAGYGSPITTVFNQRRINDGLIVNGLDLVTSSSMESNISYFMTANPVSWTGTRIAAVAGGFQNYRPLKFVIHYRPQVGSTSDLSMFIGTLWQNNYITSRDQIEPTLLTSPGGVYTPAWQSATTQVNCGRCLPQQMYPIRDNSFNVIPFSVVCRASQGGPTADATQMPGRIFIEYSYEFRNAIGGGSINYKSAFSTATVERDSQQNGIVSQTPLDGWLVDMDIPPENGMPLFCKITTDEDGTQYLVKANDSKVTSAYDMKTMKLFKTNVVTLQ